MQLFSHRTRGEVAQRHLLQIPLGQLVMGDGKRQNRGAMWPAERDALIVEQRWLAMVSPREWQPVSRDVAIGACVVCFPRGLTGAGARGDRAWAAAAVMRGGRVVCDATIDGQAGARYEPGLLALREGPISEAAVRTLALAPEVLLVDATGRDHPRRAGLALHLGAVLGVPTVGVTHRPLLASGDWPDDRGGATAPLLLDGERVGVWLRTRGGVRPLAIHPGWRTTVEVAIEIAALASSAYRTPEPFRRARRLARVARTEAGAHRWQE
jgi:deoxyribonuclease V